MNFLCFVVLGVVHLIEGEMITTASQTGPSSARPTTLMRRIDVRKADYNEHQTTDIFERRERISRRVVHLIEGEMITTASQTGPSSARPTTLMRRIDVRKADYNEQQTTDIFERRERISRRRLRLFNELWKWDFWCMLQPVTGNCGVNRTKYYYNTQLDQCLPHMFSGCSTKENMNQFESVAECENHCKGSALMPVNLPPNTDICKLQPITGRCLGHITMYYYDVNQASCRTFVYGGCAGNENKFGRELQCLYRCGHLNPEHTETLDYDISTPKDYRITEPDE